MKTKNLVLALCACTAAGVASAQSATAQGGTASSGSAPTYVVTQERYVITASQPKTREQVNEETRAVRESNPLLMGEMSPVPDVLSRPYGLQPSYGGQTSVGGQMPSESSGNLSDRQR